VQEGNPTVAHGRVVAAWCRYLSKPGDTLAEEENCNGMDDNCTVPGATNQGDCAHMIWLWDTSLTNMYTCDFIS
jgi:hypothetical protein